MHLAPQMSTFASFLALLVFATPLASAIRLIESTSLQNCGGANETGLTASLMIVKYTPDNNTLSMRLNGFSSINGHIKADIQAIIYGYNALETQIDPCQVKELIAFCPMQATPIDWPQNNVHISPDTATKIPGIAFNIPDLQASAQLRVIGNDNNDERGKIIACVQANLSNGKSVYQKSVGWATAVIAGLGLLVSAIVSGLGHSNTAAHVAANAMSLFGFFQTQALFGMTAVPLPPIVASWTQNFQWSLGIINSDSVETIATWYQRATGGTPSQLLNKLANTSINIQKRSLDIVTRNTPSVVPRAVSVMTSPHMREYFGSMILPRSFHPVVKRAVEPIAETFGRIAKRAEVGQTVTVRGITRVGFRANIEETNIFLTGYIFFIFFVMLVVVGVVAFKWTLEGLSRAGKIKSDKFQDFRNGWTTVLKGIMYRLILIGFPQMVVLCFWELTQRDSAGEVALAVITVITMLAMLAWVCTKVVLIARRSINLHKNPAYILYSDPLCLHKWGFLYVQYKAANYWFIIPQLGYILVFGMFVAFGQMNGTAQAIGLLIINLGWLVALSIVRPYMDKKTNAFNISIAAINFVSSIFILFFTNVFGLPGLVNGVMGILFFIVNVVFALVLLIMLLVASGFAIFSKNPDVRYQPMRDDRGSFIKSQTNLNNELDALGATARGENKTPFHRETDAESYSSGSLENSKGYSHVDGPTSYDGSPFAHNDRNSMHSEMTKFRAQHNASPWQRGAGYDR